MTTALLDIGLPKWAQMYVTGFPVPVEQAKEIIRRCDIFFIVPGCGGNDRAFNERWCRKLGIPHPGKGPIRVEAEATEKFKQRWKPLPLRFIHTAWVSTAEVQGPNGFIHPDGTIGYDQNIGSYPSVAEVYEDWIKVAEAFPCLNLGVTVMSGERLEINRSLVSYRVRGGTVQIYDPHIVDVHEGHPEYASVEEPFPRLPPHVRRRMTEKDKHKWVAAHREEYLEWRLSQEHGLPEAWLEEWSER